MNKEVKEKWVAALRSGKYAQSKQRLKTKYGYCCLGVLCDLAVKEGICKENPGEDIADEEISFDERTSILPQSVLNWANIDSINPHVKLESRIYPITLAECNDSLDLDFNEIANIIEKQL